MIKFFRLIRKQLLSQNRFNKYLIYAIGEIVLVVIGILIALQINNWNEENKNSKKEIYILKELKKEFQKDSTQLRNFIVLTDSKTNHGTDLKNIIINKKTFHLDTLIFKAFFNGRLVLFVSHTPTYDELVSTGKLGLLKNDQLKSEINNYKNHLNISETFFNYEAQKRKEAYNLHLFKYFEPQIMAALWEREKRENLVNYQTNPEGFLKDRETLFHINVVLGVDRELKWIYSQRTMWRITSIIQLIDKELKSKNN